VTRLGQAVSKLPLGVRYSKMLLVAAQAGILDYAIVVVAVLSECSPFSTIANPDNNVVATTKDDSELDEIDKTVVASMEERKKRSHQWFHSGGDILASMLAVGAYTYAGQGAGGSSEALATRRFCEENGLNHVIMSRIQKMRANLASIAKNRLGTVTDSVASRTGGFSCKMPPPNKLQERLLIQSIASGLLDHVAILATPGSISGDYPLDLRSAYISCSGSIKDPLFMDRSSLVYNRDYRQLPRWVCYDSILRKVAKDGTPIAVMKRITPIDPTWLGEISKETRLLSFGPPLSLPPPSYNAEQDAVLCSVTTKFGSHGWEITPVRRIMYDVVSNRATKQTSDFLPDDSYHWFARFLLEGKVIPELAGLDQYLTESPAIITRRTPSAKVTTLVSTLSGAGIDSAGALRKHWAEKDDKLLFKQLRGWIKSCDTSQAKRLWIEAVRKNVKLWNDNKV
jgi:ATP-dependent RNA helicase DHX37/DHR1